MRFKKLCNNIVIFMSVIFSIYGNAVRVDSITLGEDQECFAKIALRFENETDDEKRLKDDTNFFLNIFGDQEICDDDGGFTLLLLFRAIQSFVPTEIEDPTALRAIPMQEWHLINHSLRTTLKFFAANQYSSEFEESHNLANDLEAMSNRFNAFADGTPPTYEIFSDLGDLIEKHIAGEDKELAFE